MSIVAEWLQGLYQKAKGLFSDEKRLSRIVMGITFLCILPMYLIGMYAHPSTDDYSFAYHPYQVALNTRGLERIFGVIGAAFRATKDAYFQWSGYYTGSLFAALRPNFFNENLAFFNSFLILTVFMICVYLGARKLMESLFGFPRPFARVVSCMALLLSIQLVPSAAESFYWYTAAVTYTMLFAVSVVLLVRLAEVVYGKKEMSRKGLVLNLFLAILVAGGILPVNIPALGIMTAILLDALFSKKRKANKRTRACLLAVWAVFLAGMAVGSLSPSTFWRLDSLEEGVSLFGALIYSVYGVLMTVMGFFTPYVILAAIGLAVLAAFYVKRTKHEFKHPFFLLLVSFCVLYAAYFPIYFGTGFKLQYADSRYKNILFLHFVILLCVNIVYLVGFLSRRLKEKGEGQIRRKVTLLFLLAGMFALCFSHKDSGQEPWSVRAVKDMASGRVEQYDREMDARYADFKNPEQKNVILKHPSVVSPVIFQAEPSKEDEGTWVVDALRRYYGKESVTVADE